MSMFTVNYDLTEDMRRAINALYANPSYSTRIDTPGGTTKMSSISTPADAIADLISRLGKSGTDLSGVQKAFDVIEAEKRSKIQKALEGVADMAVIEKPTMRRFVLAYFFDGESSVVNGVAYEGAEDSDADEDGEVKVQLQQSEIYGIYEHYYSMKALRKALDDKKVQHVIKFID